MIRYIREDNFHQAHVYDSLKDDSVTELYPSCFFPFVNSIAII